jgi:hypothetical protein
MTQTTNTMYGVIVAAADRDGLIVLEPEEDTREEIEGFVSAMQQIEPDQLLRMEPYRRFFIGAIWKGLDEYDLAENGGVVSPVRLQRAADDSSGTLMKFCPKCDQWHSAFEERTTCSLCGTLCDTTQDAMSKLPEGCKSGLMGM